MRWTLLQLTARLGRDAVVCSLLLLASGTTPAQARLRDRLADRASGAPAAARPATPAATAGTVQVQRDIVYAHGSGAELLLDLYRPAGPGPHPMALYIHGGGWTEGKKEMGQLMCSALAQRGYLAASINYRLADVAPWPAQIDDARAAANWLVAHGAQYGGDPAQLVVTGGSAGGQLALSLACGWGEGGPLRAGVPAEYPWPGKPIRACCSWYGPTDMSLLATAPRMSRNLEEYLGATPEQRAVAAPGASPLLYVDAHDPPVLLIHGTKDPLVPIAQSERMEAALQAAGVPTELIAVPGGSHGIFIAKPAQLAKLVQRMIDWFDVQLGRSSP